MFKHIFDKQDLNELDPDYLKHGELIKFSQKEFFENPDENEYGMKDHGYVYIP
jgi:hypothetical protein